MRIAVQAMYDVSNTISNGQTIRVTTLSSPTHHNSTYFSSWIMGHILGQQCKPKSKALPRDTHWEKHLWWFSTCGDFCGGFHHISTTYPPHGKIHHICFSQCTCLVELTKISSKPFTVLQQKADLWWLLSTQTNQGKSFIRGKLIINSGFPAYDITRR